MENDGLSLPFSEPYSFSKQMRRTILTGNIRNVLSHVVFGLFMAMVGWLLHYRSSPSVYTISKLDNISSPRHVLDPPWWLEDDSDDFISRTYVDNLPAVRTLNNSHYFTGLCGYYRFNESALPTASIIVTLQNEVNGMLSLTIQTLLARTPPLLLREIIIVDDNGLGDIRGPVNETELQHLQTISPKIKIITNKFREGVARSRMEGARMATADVLVFVDSHVEMQSGTWLQHLLLPIVENPSTLSAQTLDIIDDIDWSYGLGGGDLLYGIITDDFFFGYQRSRFGGEAGEGPEVEKPSRRLPYETPFAAGSLFAIGRDFFWGLGGYDEGMYVWGGENTDFAIKVWTCGGRMVMVPCSRVGHMYRRHIAKTGRWPPNIPDEIMEKIGADPRLRFELDGFPVPNFSKVITRNNIRVMERWAKTSSARSGYYLKKFGSETLPTPWNLFAEQMETDHFAKVQSHFIEKNGCKDFDWFDKHVYKKFVGVHHPWHPKAKPHTWI